LCVVKSETNLFKTSVKAARLENKLLKYLYFFSRGTTLLLKTRAF
jgi:hypothetical protein